MASSPTFAQIQAKAADEITHETDGPVTRFVAIYRAIQLAREGKYPLSPEGHDPVAEALNVFLDEYDGPDRSIHSIPLNSADGL